MYFPLELIQGGIKTMQLYAKRTFALDTENAFKIGPLIAKQETQGHSIIRLNLGEPDFNVPEFIKDEIKQQLDKNNTHYCDPKGLYTLREAISHQIYLSRRIQISPEQIVIFPGAKPAIGFCQQAYCDPGDEIIYPSPGFPIYESFIRYLNAIPVPIHLSEENGFTFNIEQFIERLNPKTKMIFLNFPSNPTGGIATLKQLEEIASLILEKCHPHVRIFSDEIYEHIIYENQPHYSIASIPGMEKRTIICSGFSKSYAWTGGRIGYAVFPSVEEADVFKNLNINYFSCVPPYNQEGARVALEHPDAANHIKKMVEIFEQRRDYVIQTLNQIPGINCQKPKGTFYAFPNIQELCDNLNICEFYQKLPLPIQQQTTPSTLFQMFALYYHNVAVLDRKSFGKTGSEGEHFIRISYASDLPILKQGLSHLKNAAKDVDGFKKFINTSDLYFQ